MIKLLGGFSGINMSDKQPVQSISFGGADTNAGFEADQVVLTMQTNGYSPQVLAAFVTTSSMKVVVEGWRPDVSGKLVKFVTVTFTSARIVGFRFVGTTKAKANETVHLTFGAVTLDWIATGSFGTWQLPA